MACVTCPHNCLWTNRLLDSGHTQAAVRQEEGVPAPADHDQGWCRLLTRNQSELRGVPGGAEDRREAAAVKDPADLPSDPSSQF